MLIRLYEHKSLMHAGCEQSLAPGGQYEVADVVGRQWVARGDAVEIERDAPVTLPKGTRTRRVHG